MNYLWQSMEQERLFSLISRCRERLKVVNAIFNHQPISNLLNQKTCIPDMKIVSYL
jgi:hypothetical protein